MNEEFKQLIFGHNDEAGLVALEPVAGAEGRDEMLLFIRQGKETLQQRESFRPFFWITKPEYVAEAPIQPEIISLQGKNTYAWLCVFDSWKSMDKCMAWLKKSKGIRPSDPASPVFILNDPIQQHLLRTGRTLFKGMVFAELRRLQVDIETYATPPFEFSNPDRESDRIIAIALADQTGWTEVIPGDRLNEKEMLERFVELVREKDPDVIEGHNLFKFDLPYLMTRAKRHKVKLALGRDGSDPSTYPSRFSMADRTIAYPRAEVFGRHIVDTYFLAQAYDISHRSLESFGLKDIAIHFGVAAPDRTYIEGDEITRTFDRDPARVIQYARDDILETEAISRLLSPSYFAQAQILPFSYQNICVRGNGTKVDALMIREYLHQLASIPAPDLPRPYEGGYTDIFKVGVMSNVHHCDVRSLYPSIILKDGLTPRSDELSIFLKLLDYLRRLRLETKARMNASKSHEERINLDAFQSSFKILINSFYGYLAFAQAHFSDYALAERITQEGRDLLRRMIEELKRMGAEPIEIDTDGIYFIPPAFKSKAELEKFRKAFQESLPEGIDVEFDGEYHAMFSYKMKNYALLADHDEIIIKGAALKSRGLEPFQRNFLREWLRLTLQNKNAEIPKLYQSYRDAISRREWPITMLAKSETLQDSPETYQGKIKGGDRGRNAAYELALKSGREYRAGDQISYYVTGNNKRVAVHTSAKLVSDWDPNRRDENVPYYLAKLDALLEKFDSKPPSPEAGENLELDFG
jgi:DNA polymerase I